jgi:hypothetical protein
VKNTMTEQQATQRVEDYARQAIAQLPPQAQVKKIEAASDGCDNPSDNGPKGRVVASNSYQILGLPPGEYNHYFDTLRDWWTKNNYHLLDDQRPKDMFLWVENNNDAVRVTIEANDNGGLYIGATSPCVWPHGTPTPTT